jgi:protease-4
VKRKRKLLLFLVALLGAGAYWWYVRQGPHIPANAVLVVHLHGSYPEAAPEGLWSKLFAPRELPLPEALLTLRKCAADSRIRALIVRISDLEVGWAKATDLREAIAAVRKAGKATIALLEQEGGNANLPYYIASASERVYVVPAGNVALRGLAARYMFLGGLWEKLHIEMDVEKMAEYKTAGDFLAGKEMTTAHREMANSLLDDVNDFYLGTIALARALPVEAVRELVEQQGPSGAESLYDAKLIDGAKFLDDVRLELGADQRSLVDESTYARVPPTRLGLQRGPVVAVVLAAGTIAPGESHRSSVGAVAGADSLHRALDEASRDPAVQAIVLRVDSPGGSALASDVVWRAVQEARKRKPVVASFSDVAASGGYYIASGSTRVVAQPNTLTGSIGVVFARPNIRGFLEHWGVHTETIARGQWATLDDVTSPLSDAGRERLRTEVQRTYDLFLRRVSEGRGLPKEQVHEVGRGRVWTGRQAKDVGLVDVLGGFYTALDVAKQEAGIPADQDPALLFLPAPKGFFEALEEALETRVAASLPRLVRELIRLFPSAIDSAPAPLLPDAIVIQ